MFSGRTAPYIPYCDTVTSGGEVTRASLGISHYPGTVRYSEGTGPVAAWSSSASNDIHNIMIGLLFVTL